MNSETIGVVFDCNVFVQALVNKRGPAFACMELVDTGKLTLYVSPDVLAEVRDVLKRPKLRLKFSALTTERVAAYLQDVESKAVSLTDVPHVFSYERDPKDERYVNLAIAAEARYLVSRDNDLLDLMEDADFRSRFPDLTIVDPVTFLREFSSEVSAEEEHAEESDQ